MGEVASPLGRFIRELRRRRVFRTAALYIVGAWLVMQVADVTFPALDIPERAVRYVLFAALAGFPAALVFGWFFDIGPTGIRRTPANELGDAAESEPLRRSDYLILVALAAMVIFILYRAVGGVVETPIEAAAEQSAYRDGPPMVAVLPFTSASLGEANEFFASGVHDDLLTQLSQLEAIRVISRTSVLEYKDTVRNIREIGAALGADAILEGGVQSAGNRIRINAQLINAGTDEHIWAQTYDRELNPTNIFEVQSEIARAITVALHTTLSPQDQNQLSVIPTENMAAYRAYRRAMEMAENESPWRNPEYKAALEEAVALDPNFTRALAELSGNLSFANNWLKPNPDEIRQAEELLERLRVLAPDSADHLIAQAYYSMYVVKDYEQTFEIVTRAERKAPSDLKILNMKTWILRRMGRHAERPDVFRKILKLDPKNGRASWGMISSLLTAHNYEEAWLELENAPFDDYSHSDLRLIKSLAHSGDFDLYMSEVLALAEEHPSEYNAWQSWELTMWARDFWAAEAMLESVRRPDQEHLPGLGGYRAAKIITYLLLNEETLFQQAMEDVSQHFEASRTWEIAAEEAWVNLDLALFEGFRGNREEAIRYVRQWRRLAVLDATDYSTGWKTSCQTLAISGIATEAVDCLRTGFEQPSWALPFLEPHLPWYDPIRESPDFKALVAEIESGAYHEKWGQSKGTE
jgi:TolB-like protein